MYTDNIKLTEIVVNELLQRYLSTYSFDNLTIENVSVEVGYLSGPEYSTNSHYVSHISVSDCIKLTHTHISVSDCIKLTHTGTKTHILVAIHTKDTPVAIMIGLRELDEMINCGSKHPCVPSRFYKNPE